MARSSLIGALIALGALSSHAQETPLDVPSSTEDRGRSQIGISPQIHDLTFDEAQRTQSFRLHNFTDAPRTVRVNVLGFTLDRDGAVVVTDSTDTSIEQWVIVNPVEFSVEAQSAQTVRFTVRPAVQLEPGEHRFMIVFDEVVDQPLDDGSIRGRFQIRSAVYVRVGETDRAAAVLGADGSPADLTLVVAATGTAHARFDADLVIWPRATDLVRADDTRLPREDGAPLVPIGALQAVPIPAVPVLPGTTRTVRVPFASPLEPGDYLAQIRGALGGRPISADAIPFVVREPD